MGEGSRVFGVFLFSSSLSLSSTTLPSPALPLRVSPGTWGVVLRAGYVLLHFTLSPCSEWPYMGKW